MNTIVSKNRLLILSLSLYLLLPSAFAVEPNPVFNAAPAIRHIIDSVERERLLSRLDTRGSVRVIVGLETPLPAGHFTPEGQLADHLAVLTQRQTIARLQSSLLSRLALRAPALKRFEHIPYMALGVDHAALQSLLNAPEVTTVQEDRVIPLSLAQSAPLIGAPVAWSQGFSGAGQVIAVLDSGVQGSHPFLAGKVIDEACYSTTFPADAATSLCPNGLQRQVGPGAGRKCSGISGCDHGTHVAGIAAGKGSDFSGIAKDASLIAIQIFSRFDDPASCDPVPCIGAYFSDIIQGLERVYSLRTTYPIAAANMSLGGGDYSSIAQCEADNHAFKAAIDNLRSVGIASVIAAGNEGRADALSAPGCISSAVSVGSTTKTDAVSDFSNVASWLSLFAPGSSILSSVPGGGFGTKSGTSMATPHVAGAWAIVKSKAPEASVDEVLAALTTTGPLITDQAGGLLPPPFRTNGFTVPRIQVDAALGAFVPGELPPVNMIIDNDRAGTGSDGSWIRSTVTRAYGGDAMQSSGFGVDTYRFTPTLPHFGQYRVFAWWSGAAAASAQTAYDLRHADGLSTVEVNQRSNGGQWNELGVFTFNAGTDGYVEVSDRNGGVAIADTVRFQSVLAPDNTDTLPLTGRVTSNGRGVGGVRFSTINGATCTPSDANGAYTCTVPWGWSGIITPVASDFMIRPPSRNYLNITAPVTDQNYVAIPSSGFFGR